MARLGDHEISTVANPGRPSTQYLRTLVLETILSMAFGTRVRKYWVLGPSGEIRFFKDSYIGYVMDQKCWTKV